MNDINEDITSTEKFTGTMNSTNSYHIQNSFSSNNTQCLQQHIFLPMALGAEIKGRERKKSK